MIQISGRKTHSLFADGSVLKVFVERTGAGGTVVLRAGGRRFQATTSLALRSGEWYTVRAGRSGGSTHLRLVAHEPRSLSFSELAARAGLPEGALSEVVLHAFLRTSLPLDSERLGRVLRRVRNSAERHSSPENERARLEAIGISKNLGEEAVDAVSAFLGHDSRSQSRSGGRREGEGNRDERAPTEDDVRTAFRLSEQADSPLHLFNHVVGPGDHWIIVPLHVPDGSLEASLRICVPRTFALGDRSTPAFREATLVVDSASGRKVFTILPTADGPRAKEAGPDNDGFSQDDGAAIMTTVDSSA